MARDYGKVSSTFWTGKTGREIRAAGAETQLVALYLLTGPMSNMIGLYYLPLAMLCHDVEVSQEGASKALRSLEQIGFAGWCPELEHVFVREMAAYQIGEPLKPRDNQVKGILREWQAMSKSAFYKDFHDRYADRYHLPEAVTGNAKPQAPSKGLRSQEQEQEQEQDSSPNGELPPKVPQGADKSAGGAQRLEQPRPTLRQHLVEAADVSLPAGWPDSPELQLAIDEWLAHKRTNRGGYKRASAVKKLLAKFDSPELFRAAVEHSIANNYVGCYPPNEVQHANRNRNHRHNSGSGDSPGRERDL